MAGRPVPEAIGIVHVTGPASSMKVQQKRSGEMPILSMPERVALVSFAFDQIPSSPMLDGGVILERHGARGTYFASHDADDGRAGDIVHRGHEVRRRASHEHEWPNGLNRGEINLAALKACPLYGDDDVYRAALARIHEVSAGGWLVFHTQNVSERPCSQGARSVVFDYVVRTVIEARLPVMTIGAALQHLSRR